MNEVTFSVLFPIPGTIKYPEEKLVRMFNTILLQQISPKRIYIINQQQDDRISQRLFEHAEKAAVNCEIIPAKQQFFQACAHVLAKIKTSHFLFIQNNSAPVYLRNSALSLYAWAAVRNAKAGLFYSDYDLLESNDSKKEMHLLQFHQGRVRDNMDFGLVFAIKTAAAKKVGGFSSRYPHGYFYDFRLKLSEMSALILVSNRYQGAPYSVEAVEKGHNVFDYLLSTKDVQLETEQIVTEYLQRIGAYLAPGGYDCEVIYSPEEESKFKKCIASVVIPVNNRPQFIGTAIESVLQQTVKEVEVIVVVNGGQSDPTAEVVRDYQVGGKKYQAALPQVKLVVLDINNIGLCLNEGLKAASGKYYVQLDSDDRLKPFAVERLLEVFNSDPHIGMTIGSYEVWQKDEDGSFFRREDIPVVTHDEWTAENGRNNLLRINGAGAPRSAHIKVLKEMGWFSVNDVPYSRNYGEDYEMVLKVSEKYRIGRVWEPIYEVVRHSGGTDHAIDQITVDRNDNAKDYMRLESIHRRQKMNQP